MHHIGSDLKIHKVHLELQLLTGQALVCELDSGTIHHLIPYSVIREFSLVESIRPSEERLFVADGGALNVLGEVSLQVCWGDRVVSLTFLVCEKLRIPLLAHRRLTEFGVNLWAEGKEEAERIQLEGLWFYRVSPRLYRPEVLSSASLFGDALTGATVQDVASSEELESKWFAFAVEAQQESSVPLRREALS